MKDGASKKKGFNKVRLRDNTIHTAEIHWYEAHGTGKKEFKLIFLMQQFSKKRKCGKF